MTLVTDTWTDPGASGLIPDTGTITLQTVVTAANTSDPARMVTTKPVTCVLDDLGRTEFDVVDSFDPGWGLEPGEPMPYRVTRRLGSGYKSYCVILTGAETHLRDLEPVDDVDVAPYPVPGAKGDQGEVAVDSTVTGAPGTPALVEDLDASPHRALLKFTIPQGTEVQVGTTTTGAAGTPASVTDTDPSPNRAVLDFVVPRGDKGDPGPAIGGILTTKGDLVARDAATAVRVPVGANATVLEADSAAASGVKWGAAKADKATVGNLLTENQASGTDTLGDTTGFLGSSATLTSDAAAAIQGTRGLKVVGASAGGFYVGSTYADAPARGLAGGQPVTFAVSMKAPAITRTGTMYIYWYTETGPASTPYSFVSLPPLSTVAAERRITAVAPADATRAGARVVINFGAAGEEAHIDRLGLWKGAGGDWAMPGTPITGTVPADGIPTVTLWADLPTYTTVPLGTRYHVTSGLGVLYALRGPTGWVVAPESFTGELLTTLLNGWTQGTGGLKIERTGRLVTLHAMYIVGTAATSNVAYNLPVGWRPIRGVEPIPTQQFNASGLDWARITTLGDVYSNAKTTSVRFICHYPTADAWPTSAPA